MSSFFLLITVVAGTDEALVEKLKALPIVDEVYEIYGAFDIIARITAPSEKDVRSLTADLSSMANVKTTETIPVVKEWRKTAS